MTIAGLINSLRGPRYQDAIIAGLKAENEELKAIVSQLQTEWNRMPTADDVRRSDAIIYREQRIVTDVATYNLLRRCLHPDSRSSVSAGIMHQAWLAFHNLKALTYDNKVPPPRPPRDFNELWMRRYNQTI
jgi:hypothetical protein